MERPGWQWSERLGGETVKPRNPPLEAREVLDRARQIDPDAELVLWRVEHEHNEDCLDDEGECRTYDDQCYAALAEFLGREVIMFATDETA
jgi:hypothetical protein